MDIATLPVQLTANTPEGSPGQFSITQPPMIGSLIGTPPNLTYVPGISAERYVDLFRVGFSNGIESTEIEVNVTVYWLSSEPYNQDQSFTSREDSLGSFWLGGMDRSSFINVGPTNGVLLPWDQLPHVLYLPNTNFAGVNHFQFATLGAFGTGNIATVQIRMQPVPDAPGVQAQFITVTQDTTVAITAAVTDADAGWYPLVVSLGTSPLHGSIMSSGYKQFTYRPTPGYFGPDSFTYDYHDELFWGTATIDITVLRSDFPPFAQDQFVTTDLETALGVTLLASDPDGDAVTYQVTTPPTSGTLSGTAPQLFYTPNTGFSGIDSLQYRLSDSQLDSTLATVSLTVLPPAPPAAPTGLIATGVSRSQIDLQWFDNSRNEDGFEIERANDNKSWKLIATAGRDVRTYANTGLTGNKSYSYRVRAVNRFGASPFSATASAGTLR